MARRGFEEGSWFLIPVPEEHRASAPECRFGAGIVARGTQGHNVFAYIFGPYAVPPEPIELERLEPGGELMQRLVLVRTIQEGQFPIIRTSESFTRDRWPMPEFHMYMGGDNSARAIRTSDEDPFEPISERWVTAEEALRLPQWAYGGGYLEIYRKLVDPQARIPVLSDLYREPTGGRKIEAAHERRVDVQFIVDNAKSGDELTRSLRSLGWSIDEGPSENLDQTWVTGNRRMRTSADALETVDEAMQQLADSLPGVEYDGHGIDLRGV